LSDYDREMILDSWLITVFNEAYEIDPDSELDWFSLAYGFALGKGLGPENARSFANSLGPGEI